MLQMSSTSIERSFFPVLSLNIEQISLIPSTKAPGPDAVPPNVFTGAPNSRTKIVEYVKDLPVTKKDSRTLWSNSRQPCLESGIIKSASDVLSDLT